MDDTIHGEGIHLLRRIAFRCAVAAVLAAVTLAGTAALASPPAPPEAGKPALPAADPGAAAPVTREEAVAIARRTFSIPDSLGDPYASASAGPDGEVVWHLVWRPGKDQPGGPSIQVQVDGVTGEIRSYSHFEPDAQPGAAVTLTRAEALQRAQEWLDRLAAAYKAELRLAEDPLAPQYVPPGGGTAYSFRWQRLVHGYPSREDGVEVVIDARDGRLAGFSRQWRKTAVFPLPPALLPRAQAEAAYRALPLVLQYRSFHRPGADRPEWRLVYWPAMDFLPVLDQEGRFLDPGGEPFDVDAWRRLPVLPAADRPYRPPGRPLGREEALALAQAVAGRQDPPSRVDYQELGDTRRPVWEFAWMGSDKTDNLSIRVDAGRGVVLEYSQWRSVQPLGPEEQPAVSPEAARQAAIAFLLRARPDLAGAALVLPQAGDPVALKMRLAGERVPFYTVRFWHLHQGLPVGGWFTNVTVDARTGQVRSLGSADAWQDVPPLPPAGPALAPAEAAAALVRYARLDLVWATFWAPRPPGQSPGEPRSQLVWAPHTGLPLAALDAATGAPLDYTGRNLADLLRRPADIEGHFAAREIELLWARGVLEAPEGRFMPDRPASLADLVRWLAMVRGVAPYGKYDFAAGGLPSRAAQALAASPAAPYLGGAFRAGILDPEDFAAVPADPEAPVPRQVFALWAVRAMGYGRIARMPVRIELPLADAARIGDRYRNAVAILYGLGVVRGDGGSFWPERPITRGEAARILVGVLGHGG